MPVLPTSPRSRRGAALFLVLAVIAALSAVVVTGMRTVSVDVSGARSVRNRIQALALARSGSLLAASLLLLDYKDNAYDHENEDWARYFSDPELRLKRLDQDGLGSERLLAFIGDDRLSGQIVDESGKFPVNALDSQQAETYKRVLTALLRNEPFNLEERKAKTLVMAITDWIDANGETSQEDETGLGATGAEDDAYMEAETAYRCKDDSLDSLQELLLVRGMSRDLFQGAEGRLGLKDLLSVWSASKININTAPGPLVRALAAEAQARDADAFAKAVLTFRREERNEDVLKNEDWFFANLAEGKNLQLPLEIITVKSSVFTIRMTAREGARGTTLFTAVRRGYDNTLPESLPFKGIIKTLYRSVR